MRVKGLLLVLSCCSWGPQPSGPATSLNPAGRVVTSCLGKCDEIALLETCCLGRVAAASIQWAKLLLMAHKNRLPTNQAGLCPSTESQ